MTRPGEVQVGRRAAQAPPAAVKAPARWMAAPDRIRLTGLLRESPASAGLSYTRYGEHEALIAIDSLDGP